MRVLRGAALQLHDGTIVTGSNSPLFHSASAALIKGIKHLAGMRRHIHLLPANVINDLTELKGRTTWAPRRRA